MINYRCQHFKNEQHLVWGDCIFS